MQVIYEGVDIYPEISVHRCFHDMYAEKQSDELTLALNDTRALWDVWNPQKGDSLEIVDGAAKTGRMTISSITPQPGIVTLRAYSMPDSMRLSRSKAWERVKFLQLAREIAARHGLTLQTYGITDRLYEYVKQDGVSDAAFLQQRCALEGAAFLIYDGALVLYDEAFIEAQPPLQTLSIAAANDFTYRSKSGCGAVRLTNGDISGSFLGGDGKTLEISLPLPMGSVGEADRFAKNIFRDVNKYAQAGELICGNLLRDFAAGSVVKIATGSVPSWDGSAFITHLRHDYVKCKSKLFLRKLPVGGIS